MTGQEPVGTVKKVVAVLRRALRPFATLARESRRDDGVIGLIIVIALLAAAAALIATTARQNKDAEVRRLSGNATSVKLLKNSISSFFLTDADGAGAGTAVNSRIPCPDASFPPDGTADGTTSCTANTGVVPWLTLGLSEDDVTDTYGNYFTYAVSGDSTARAICTSVTNQYDTSQIEYTGGLNAVTDTEARLSSQTAGQGTPYYFAFISHGKNGLGAISRSGARRSSPTSTSEIQNCPATNTNCTDPSALTVITGPKDTTDSTYFDDNVYIGSAAQLTAMCASLAPGKGKVNAEVNESFTNTAVGALPTTLAAPPTGTGATTQQSTVAGNTTNKVLQFAGANTAIRTATTVFNTAERARYISFQWRPTTVPSSTSGVSIGLRATAGDRNTTTAVATFDADLFNASTLDGITIRYFDDAATNADGAVTNRIYICDNIRSACDNTGGNGGAGNLASSDTDTFTITNGAAYNVEAYDDGTNIWARITQVTDASNNTIVNSTNTAFVTFSTVPIPQQDFTGNNSILLINYSDATVEVDDLLVGRASMAVSFQTDDILETAGDSHDTTTGNLTLETWIRPDTLPSGSAKSTLISKWTDGGANAVEAYRLYLTNGGALALDLAGDGTAGGVNIVTTTINFGGYQATVGQWDHIAVTFDRTEQAAKLYVNRELISRVSSALFDTAVGINDGTAAFSIGAERNNSSTIVNPFDGAMTDVRVWDTARTAQQVFANYNARLPLTSGGAAGLIVNWTLDRDSGATFAGTTATATAASNAGATGTFATTSAPSPSYIAATQQFIPALSTSFCAASSVVGAFECDYRFTTQSGSITIPSNLAAVHVKAWGAGGGGYDASALLYPASGNGGGSGYSAGRVQTINGTGITAALGVRVDVGGGGGSSSGNNGAGGGGASGLWRDVDSTNTVTAGDFAGVIGGGGGGASYGDDNLGQGVDCRSAGACGPGGGGGGPFNFTTLARDQTARAADSSDNTCGGRGGDNAAFGANPPDTTDNNCESGGDPDPNSTVGASGAGTSAGGVSIIGAGGAGFNGVAPEIGAGGGGGGVRVSAMTSGGGQAGGYDLNGAGQAGTTDANGTGFGAGGGAGFADTGASGVIGAAGSALTPGGTTDPNYALATCTIVTCPTTTPGRGGESGSTTGKTGAVILKW